MAPSTPFVPDDRRSIGALIADGWERRDFRPMPEDDWAALLDAIGEGDFRLMTLAVTDWPGDTRTFKRGQMLVSPAGAERLRRYLGGGAA